MPLVRLIAGLALAAALAPSLAAARGLDSCPPDPRDRHPIDPTRVVRGDFAAALEGSYVMIPFRVRRGTTAVRVRYCYDQPDTKPPGSPVGNTLDLGLYEARSGPRDRWNRDEFRGWGGSSHPDVTVAPNGFSPVRHYLRAPKTNVRGYTTRGFEPGPIPPGLWAVELGLGSIADESEGDDDASIAWRLEIQEIRDRRYASRPYSPAPYSRRQARRASGWYAGDLHVHGEHSALGDATMREIFDFAFAPLSAGGAGLDFIALSDYVTDSAWGEIGRYQRDYRRKLIIPSAEVVTYRGHANNHGSLRYVDHRTGPILLWRGKRPLRQLRRPRPAWRVFRQVRRGGGWTQINHPTIFPSEVPMFGSFCRGCSWAYSAPQTRYRMVDAIEIATGPAGLKTEPQPGPNPFTLLALEFYEDALATGAHIAAVGSSDSHHAGEVDDQPQSQVTQSPIGQATTVVYAPHLSMRGIAHGVRAGHTYVKVFGNDGPDLRFVGRAPYGSDVAIMGGSLEASAAEFRARVIGAGPSAARPGPYVLSVLRNGEAMLSVPVVGNDFTLPFSAILPGRYSLLLTRQSGVGAIEAVSTPIWLTG